MNIEKIFAKSEQNGKMNLLSHLKKCAVECYTNAINVGASEDVQQLAFICGLFHDLGKCKESFQKYLKGGKYSEHAVSSAYIFDRRIHIEMNNELRIGFLDKQYITRSILHHHPCDGDYTKSYNLKSDLTANDNEIIKEFIKKLIEYYDDYFNSTKKYILSYAEKEEITEDDVTYFNKASAPDIVKNRESKFFVLSGILRFSDIVSSYEESHIDYNKYLFNGLYKDSNRGFIKPEGYDDRFYEQKKTAALLNKNDFSILEAPTGFGKTMLGVIYLLSNDKKGYWVCPRNSIAESVYKTVKKEVEHLGFSDRISVGLLLTNEYIYGDKNSDIIVTNIDNYVRPLLKNDVNDLSMNMIYNNVIFDEFHEYIDKQLYGMFVSIVAARSKLKGVKTLLMSATLPPYDRQSFIYKYFDIDKDYQPITRKDIKCNEISNKKYRVVFTDNIEESVFGKSTLVNLNSVSSAQTFYGKKLVDRLIHSRYTENDLKRIKEKLYEEHDKSAIRNSKEVYSNTSYSSTNMISTGVDVSFCNLKYNYIQPDRLIQLLGRINRFFECTEEVPTIILLKSEFNVKSERYSVGLDYDIELSEKFYAYLTKNIENNSIISLEELYGLRDRFYKEYASDIEKYMNEVESESFDHLGNLKYLKTNHFKEDSSKRISNGVTMRDDGKAMKFFAIFKNAKTGVMTEPIQVDDVYIRKSFLSEDNTIKKAVNYIKKHDLLKAYFNRKKIDKLSISTPDLHAKLLNLATCDETPFPIVSCYKYSSEIGIFEENKFKK